MHAFAKFLKTFLLCPISSISKNCINSFANRSAPFLPNFFITSVRSSGGRYFSFEISRSTIFSGGNESRIPFAMPSLPSLLTWSIITKGILCFRFPSTTKFCIAVSFPAPICP
ncbi:hypothetical protein B5V91_03350 [Heyndrickxia sporothermodurans]|nr:hypothetical protein B5V91_03350 [Heyndrickxia sporothermodurans]